MRTNGEVPGVSVIVPTLDGGDMLLRCLDTVVASPHVTQIVIVDNASTDGSPEGALARHPEATVIRNERNLGYAAACAQGAEASTGSFLLFLNNDALIEPEHLDRLVAVAGGDRTGAIWAPVVEAPDGSVESAGELFTWTGFLVHLTEPRSEPAYPVFSVTGACMLVRADVYRRTGGFDPTYFAYSEDTDLCWRARLAGYEVRVVPGARAQHARNVTARRVLAPRDVRALTFRNRLRTILADASRASLAVIVPLHVSASLAVALIHVLAGRPATGAAVARAVLTPAGRGVLREQRRRAQALRRVPERIVLRSEVRGSLGLGGMRDLLKAHLRRWGPDRSRAAAARRR